MLKEQTNLYTSIILISLIFFIIVIGIIVLVITYYRKKRTHLEEKKLLNQKFESELLKTQIEVQEQTMQLIASNLHDNIGQLLSLTNLTLGSVNVREEEKAEKKIDTSIELVNKSISELRALAKLLHGEQLLELGIAAAIEQEVSWLSKAEIYQVQFENEMKGTSLLSPQKDLVILRLFQEIVNNIVKHALATKIEIKLHQQEDWIFLSVDENGIGFDYDEARKKNNGLGLYSIEKRVKMIGGSFDLQSSINKGTKIIIQIPYP
ncbi:sensor histidine kinase [Pedobacter sp.]